MWQSHAKLSFLNDDEDRAQPRRVGRLNSVKCRGWGKGETDMIEHVAKTTWKLSWVFIHVVDFNSHICACVGENKTMKMASFCKHIFHIWILPTWCVCACVSVCIRMCVCSYADKTNGLDRQKHKTDWVDMTKTVGNQLKGCRTYTPKQTHTHTIHMCKCVASYSYIQNLCEYFVSASTCSRWKLLPVHDFHLRLHFEEMLQIATDVRGTNRNCLERTCHANRHRAAISHFIHISRIVAPAWK